MEEYDILVIYPWSENWALPVKNDSVPLQSTQFSEYLVGFQPVKTHDVCLNSKHLLLYNASLTFIITEGHYAYD